MIVIGVDPGPTQSAYVVWDGVRVHHKGILPNGHLVSWLNQVMVDAVVFEQVESFGMAVGRDVFETVFETGRMFQIVASIAQRMPRREVKMHLCHSMRAKDSNIRAALIDRFGGSKAAAIGLKRSPGPLYGVRSHEWSALALAVTWFDQHEGEKDNDEKEDGGKEGGGTEACQGPKKANRTLPGMSLGDTELNKLARVYVDDRDARLEAGLAEKQAKDAVLSAMTRKKMTAYRYDTGDEIFDISVEVKDPTPTLKVKVTTKAPDEGAEGE